VQQRQRPAVSGAGPITGRCGPDGGGQARSWSPGLLAPCATAAAAQGLRRAADGGELHLHLMGRLGGRQSQHSKSGGKTLGPATRGPPRRGSSRVQGRRARQWRTIQRELRIGCDRCVNKTPRAARPCHASRPAASASFEDPHRCALASPRPSASPREPPRAWSAPTASSGVLGAQQPCLRTSSRRQARAVPDRDARTPPRAAAAPRPRPIADTSSQRARRLHVARQRLQAQPG
jgi:hypothetical protein